MAAVVLAVVAPQPAYADVTAVRGYACSYWVNVGLFGGPPSLRGCGSGVASTNAGFSPEVTLPPGGSATPITQTDVDGARAQYGPAVIHGGIWPDNVASATASGPQSASTQGTTGPGGSVHSTADITLRDQPWPAVGCAAGFTPPCLDPGGFGPPPVYGDSLHAECTATETSVTGSATFVNSFIAKATDADGAPLPSATEPIPTNPPPNYTRSGIISNVGDVFTVVLNQQIVNPDGSLTVNAVHMYLFGPTAVGEMVRGSVTCGTTPSPLTPADTVPPTCSTPVIQQVHPDDPTPVSPLTVYVGVFDAGLGTQGTGVDRIENVQSTNGTVSFSAFTSGHTGPIAGSAQRTAAAEAANLPLSFSFDVVDEAGNVTHCDYPSIRPAVLTVGDATPSPAPEGDTGTSTVTFPVTLSAAQATPVTVSYATQYGTATAGTDYVYQEGSVTFAPGETTKPVTVTINGDTELEDAETFFIQLYNPQLPIAVTMGDRFGQATIANDDAGALPVLNIADAGSVPENSGPANFEITLSAPSAAPVTVSYATQYGSATRNVDYVYQESSVTFAPGETSKTVAVTLNGDANWEQDESFFVQLYNQTGATLGDNFGMAIIQNDDPTTVVSISDGAFTTAPSTEGSSQRQMIFTVSIPTPAGPSGVRVSYATGYGSATPGSSGTADYFATSGTAIINSGATSTNVQIAVRGDTTPEADESFFVQLYNPIGATLGDAWGMGVIVNDDAGTPLTVSIGAGTPNPAPEGDVGAANTISFPVTLSAAAPSGGVTVSYATMPGYNGSTATAGADYVYKEGTITIPAGQTSGTIVINVTGDEVTGEGTENLWVQIYHPTNGALNPTARYAEGFILDDD